MFWCSSLLPIVKQVVRGSPKRPRTQCHRVDLALDYDSGFLASEQIHRLIELSILNYQGGLILLEFLE